MNARREATQYTAAATNRPTRQDGATNESVCTIIKLITHNHGKLDRLMKSALSSDEMRLDEMKSVSNAL